MVTFSNDSTTVTRSRPSIGTACGTATTWQPAACPEPTPVGESSSTTQCAGSTPSSSAARRYGSGCGLPRTTSLPETVNRKCSAPIEGSEASMIRRDDAETRATGTPRASSSSSSRLAPGSIGTPVRSRSIIASSTPSSSSSRVRSPPHSPSRYVVESSIGLPSTFG